MALYEFEGKRPQIGAETYVSESADVIGDVAIGNNCYIGPGARIKGDYGSIIIGNKTNVQENCVLHARPGKKCVVGNGCFISHGSILHNCTINDNARVGMGAIVSDYAVVGKSAVLGEGCIVVQKQEIPPHAVAVGMPAKVVGKQLTTERLTEQEGYSNVYVELAKRYLSSLKRID
ncbi:MAG: gamma carbonic anhydrase family protein [Planctomycetota bacterium]